MEMNVEKTQLKLSFCFVFIELQKHPVQVNPEDLISKEQQFIPVTVDVAKRIVQETKNKYEWSKDTMMDS